ncbi:RNA polymerase sigma factor region1.1 domain-containing protein, partial [uncultured Maritalea sp.]|uniref:RNA polymerase sigma factor region1.1 domain-containing protein n=1 Tax=uncultured Maritalea sp. TaxID=757249 RepID=UPI0026154DBB
MATKAQKETEKPESGESQDGPLLDLSASAVKKMIKGAKKRGYVTYDQLNEVLPSNEVSSEQIEDIMAMLSEMGISVIEEDEVEEHEAEQRAKTGTEVAVATGTAIASKSNAREGSDRTDDPVRMYLREMGTVELLSREGEIAIAKRIEAGRDTMIKGLCESALTFEAIMVWREELEEERILLRDIIDLDSTYNLSIGNVQEDRSAAAVRREKIERGEIEPEKGEKIEKPKHGPVLKLATHAEGEKTLEDDDEEDEDEKINLSMAAMEAELRESIFEILNNIGQDFARFQQLQDMLIRARLKGKTLRKPQAEQYAELQNKIIEELKSLQLNNARIEALVEQLYA